MIWGSALIGDDFDADTDEPDADKAWVIKQLMQHPVLKNSVGVVAFGNNSKSPTGGGGKLGEGSSAASEVDTPEEKEKKKKLMEEMRQEGMKLASDAGWFEDSFGKSASALVKDLRLKRRVHKQFSQDIDDAIMAIRMAKSNEVQRGLDSITWGGDYLDAIKGMNLNDKDFKALIKHGEKRQVSLIQACNQWQDANNVLTKLSQIDGEFNEEQLSLWSDATKMKKDARQMWRHSLHRSSKLNKAEQDSLLSASDLLDYHGPMDSRTMHTYMTSNDGRSAGLPSVQQLGALLKTYGPDYDIFKHGTLWERQSAQSPLLVKDPWAYAAGFLDADGYITISKKGEPRAGFVATGDRGKVHCENLYEMIGAGVLSLDLKVHKSSKRSQHRLQFYSKDDISKLLKGTYPHLRLKKNQARNVMELLSHRGKDGDLISKRRDELYRLVKWENWKDVKAEELLNEWNVDEQEVLSWDSTDPDAIGFEVV